MSSISNSLVGLSLLTGSSALSSFGQSFKVESAAVRIAKAAFTLPETTPPWKEAGGSTTESSQLAAVKRLKTIIDKAGSGIDALPTDVQTSFTTYKALDRLRILAEAAAKTTTGSGERTKLDGLFAQGLSDLQTFLGSAPSEKLDLAFGIPTRRAESVGISVQSALEVKGQGILPARDTPIPGMTGNETFTITLNKFGTSDSVSVDLAGTPQPPTLDSIADAVNSAIEAIPLRNPDGSIYIDPGTGQPTPKWLVRFVPDKNTDKWGFALTNPALEDISINQDNAADAIIVAAGQTAPDAPERVRLIRFDDPAGAVEQKTLGEIAGYDRLGTERFKLSTPPPEPIAGITLPEQELFAPTSAAAVVTAPDGSSYMIGTTAGELGANRPAGAQDLVLTKLDSEGRTLWQRMLGAADNANGAAISLADNGDIVVAGTVTGSFGAEDSDGDILVARYDTSGDEQFTSLALNIRFHRFSHLVRVFEIDRHHAQIITDKLNQMMVGHNAWKFADQAAFMRIIKVRLQRSCAILAKQGEELKKQSEQVQIIAVFPPRAFKRTHQPFARQLHCTHRIGNNERPDRRATDSHHLMGQSIHDDVHLAASHHEAAKHTDQDNNETNAIQHGRTVPLRNQNKLSSIIGWPQHTRSQGVRNVYHISYSYGVSLLGNAASRLNILL